MSEKRLIDAEALKIKVEAMVEHKVQESDYEYGRNQILDYVADILIEDAPTIDAEPVVRCKDCDRGFGSPVCPIQSKGWAINKDTFFCAWGKRSRT